MGAHVPRNLTRGAGAWEEAGTFRGRDTTPMDTTTSRALRARLAALLVVGVALLAPGCRHSTAPFVWVDELTTPEGADAYVIRPGDVIAVRVYQQDAMSVTGRVRQDGRISVPFLKDVAAAGYSPNALAEQLQTRFKDFVNNPVVTVSLEQALPLNVTVLGEVTRPGTYPLDGGRGVLAALAAAGGLTDYANEDHIFVVRPQQDKATERIRFRYGALVGGQGKAPTFTLRAGDSVVVE